MTTYFPDLNVLLPIVQLQHPHHAAASLWLEEVPSEGRIILCRVTQMSLLRLLTTRPVMGSEVLTQRQAWSLLDFLLRDKRFIVADEPADCWNRFRVRTERDEVSPKHWADAYLAAFAFSAGLRLVTFDHALATSVPDSVFLTA